MYMYILSVVSLWGGLSKLFLCFRYQGFARDGGFEGEAENRQSVTIFGRTYWQVISARLAFVVLFEVSNQINVTTMFHQVRSGTCLILD